MCAISSLTSTFAISSPDEFLFSKCGPRSLSGGDLLNIQHVRCRRKTIVRFTSVSNSTFDSLYMWSTSYKWLQFLFIVKAAVLKQQISKFYSQIQRTEASDHIYHTLAR